MTSKASLVLSGCLLLQHLSGCSDEDLAARGARAAAGNDAGDIDGAVLGQPEIGKDAAPDRDPRAGDAQATDVDAGLGSADGAAPDGGAGALELTIRGPRSYVFFEENHAWKVFDPARPLDLLAGPSSVEGLVGAGAFDPATHRLVNSALRHGIGLENGAFYRFDAIVGTPLTRTTTARDGSITFRSPMTRRSTDFCGLSVVEDWSDPLKSYVFYTLAGGDADCLTEPQVRKMFRLDAAETTQPVTLPYLYWTANRDPQTGAITGWNAQPDCGSYPCAPAIVKTDTDFANPSALQTPTELYGTTLTTLPGGTRVILTRLNGGIQVVRHDPRTGSVQPVLDVTGLREASSYLLRDEHNLYLRLENSSASRYEFYRIPLTTGQGVRVTSDATSELVGLTDDHIVLRREGGLSIATKLGHDVAATTLVQSDRLLLVVAARGQFVYYNDISAGNAAIVSTTGQPVAEFLQSDWLPSSRAPVAPHPDVPFVLLAKRVANDFQKAAIYSFELVTGQEGPLLGTIDADEHFLVNPVFLAPAGSADTFLLRFERAKVGALGGDNELYFGHGRQAGTLVRLTHEIDSHQWRVYAEQPE